MSKETNFRPVKSADRVLDIFEELLNHPDGVSIHNLGKGLGVASSSIHALVHTMLNRKYLKMDAGRKLHLGNKFYEFTNLFAHNVVIRSATPVMKQLAQEVNENIHLAILDGYDVIFIAFEETNHPIRFHMKVGQTQKAHVSGVGKMLLSNLPDRSIESMYENFVFERYTDTTICSTRDLLLELNKIRKCGYSIDNSEFTPGSKCFAAPITDKLNNMIASISISVPFMRSDNLREDELITSIQKAAKQISMNLSHY